MRRWGWAGVLASGLVAACAQNRLPPPFISAAPPVVFVTPTTAPPPQASVDHASFSNLPGWAQEDHAAALAAFAVGCSAARAHDMAAACRRARDLGPVSDATARWFFETRFRLEALAQPGLLTAYFSPVYAARAQPDGEFSSPVRPRPVDLAKYASPMGGAYGDRADIEARPADDAVRGCAPRICFFCKSKDPAC